MQPRVAIKTKNRERMRHPPFIGSYDGERQQPLKSTTDIKCEE
jgi:hypothetical protein